MKIRNSIVWSLSVFIIFLMSCCIYSSKSQEIGDVLTYKQGKELNYFVTTYKIKEAIVSGTYIFKEDNLKTAIKKLNKIKKHNKEVLQTLIDINKITDKYIKKFENAKVKK